MKVYEYFQILRSHFPEIQDHEEVKVTLTDLSEILHCSPRNTKLLLIKMTDYHWISFISGKGRGNLSTLIFRTQYEQILKEQMEAFLSKQDFLGALSFLQTNWRFVSHKEKLHRLLLSHFGVQTESSDNGMVETLRIPLQRKFNTFIPSKAFYAFDVHLIRQIFNTLVTFDEQSTQLLPSLAHHWEPNHMHEKWTFYLRKKVLFHNGRELTAEDVLYTFHSLSEMKSNWMMKQIKSVEVINRYCIKFHLFKPNRMFPLYLCNQQASIIPVGGTSESLPIGTGPYKVTHFSSDNCFLQAFERYFEHTPQMDRVEIYNLSDLHYVEQPNLFKEGDIFFETVEFKQTNFDDFVEKHDISGPTVLTLNQNKQSVMNDHLFRNAIQKLLHVNRLVHELGGWRLSPSNGFMNRAKSIVDIETGIKLLEKSCYEGETLDLFTFERHAKDAYWIAKELNRYGIAINVEIVDWDQMLNEKNVQEADMILFEAEFSKGILRLIEYYLSDHSFIHQHLSRGAKEYIDSVFNETMSKSFAMDDLRESLSNIEEYIIQHSSFIFLSNVYFRSYSHPSLAVNSNEKGWVDYKHYWFKSNI
jgi:SgrR family transcriptional regulator